MACRLPFRMVDNIQFRRMLHMIAGPNSHIAIPNRNRIRERLVELSLESQHKLIVEIPEDVKVSIALDCWTSPDQKPFMAITGYFITEDFHYREVLLGFPPVPGSHTGSNLAEIVIQTIKRHGLCHRILGMTTDNVSGHNSTAA